MRNRRTIIIGVVVVVLAVIGVAALLVYAQLQSSPTPLGAPSGEIAFISDREGDWDILILDSEGNIRNLTADDSNADDYFPSFAFDGEMINFLTNRHEDESDLGPGQVRQDGGELRTLSVAGAAMSVIREGRTDWDPAWAADGERIAWASLRDLNLEIYVGDAAGTERQRLTNDFGRDWFPVIAPDGETVLFTSDREGNENIYRIDANGEDFTQLTDSEFDDLQPVWSMDNDNILYVQDTDNILMAGELDLYIMNPDGSDKRPFGADERFEGDPIYAADGEQVVYMSNEDGFWHLYLMNADGSNVRRLTEGEHNNMFAVWRPLPADIADEE